MGKVRLFMVSLILFLGACSNKKDQQQFDFNEEQPVEISIDTTTKHKIVGTWTLVAVNDKQLMKQNPLFGLKQVFLNDNTWILSQNKEDSAVVGGGRWTYDPYTRQLNVFALPDSISRTSLLKQVNDEVLETETFSGTKQKWLRLKNDPEKPL